MPLVVIDGLNQSVKSWGYLVADTANLPIKYLITSRQEDWHLYGQTNIQNISISNIEIFLSQNEAKQIYNNFQREKKISLKVKHWQTAWEQIKEKGLLIEFVYILTQGKMIEERLQEQINNLREKKEFKKLDILSFVSLANVCQVKLKTDKVKNLTNIKSHSQFNSILASLNKEYQVTITENSYIEGLHPVRSHHLLNILTSNIPISSIAKGLLEIVEPKEIEIFTSNVINLIKSIKEKRDFLKILSIHTSKMSYSYIYRVILGIFSTDARLHWKINKESYNIAYEKNIGLIYAIDFSPWQKEILKSLIDRNNNGNQTIADMYKNMQIFEPEQSNINVFLNELSKEFKKDELQSNLIDLWNISLWFKRFNILCPLLKKVKNINTLMKELPIEKFAKFLFALNAVYESKYIDFINTYKKELISKIKVETETLSFYEKEKQVYLKYIPKSITDKNLNSQSVKRLEIVWLCFPYEYEKYNIKGLYPPFDFFNQNLSRYDETNKSLSNEALETGEFQVTSNKTWLKEIRKNYEFSSLYEWQEFIYNIRVKSIDFLHSITLFFENVLRDNNEYLDKKGSKIDNQKKVVNSYFTNSKLIKYDKSFEEDIFGNHVKKVQKFTDSLNLVIKQFYPSDSLWKTWLYNIQDCCRKLIAMQDSFQFIIKNTTQYFETSELENKEIEAYNRFERTSAFFSKKKDDNSDTLQNIKETILNWWTNIEKLKIIQLAKKLQAFEQVTDYKIIIPNQLIQEEALMKAAIGIEGLSIKKSDAYLMILLEYLTQMIDLEIDGYYIVFINNQKAEKTVVSISKNTLEEYKKIMEEDYLSDKTPRIFPLPITNKIISSFSNVDITKDEIPEEIKLKATIIADLWELGEINKWLIEKNNLELKWKEELKKKIELKIRKNLVTINDISFTEKVDLPVVLSEKDLNDLFYQIFKDYQHLN